MTDMTVQTQSGPGGEAHRRGQKDSTKRRRHVVTLSHMPLDLEEWARAEAKRTNKPFYHIVNETLALLRLTKKGCHTPGGRRQRQDRARSARPGL